MNKEDIFARLKHQGILYHVAEHKAVTTIAEKTLCFPADAEVIAKNLFLCDDRRQDYYLVLLQNDKVLNLKSLREQIGSRRLTFANEQELGRILGLTAGGVSPFGIWNDSKRRTTLLVDSFFCGKEIGVHPNDNTVTVWLSADALLDMVRCHGNRAEWIKI